MTIIPEDHIELSLEQSLDRCIKCNICTAACPVSAVTDMFPGPKVCWSAGATFSDMNASRHPMRRWITVQDAACAMRSARPACGSPS